MIRKWLRSLVGDVEIEVVVILSLLMLVIPGVHHSLKFTILMRVMLVVVAQGRIVMKCLDRRHAREPVMRFIVLNEMILFVSAFVGTLLHL